jgi:hypothetical protein
MKVPIIKEIESIPSVQGSQLWHLSKTVVSEVAAVISIVMYSPANGTETFFFIV